MVADDTAWHRRLKVFDGNEQQANRLRTWLR
jgi:hypothetical protein